MRSSAFNFTAVPEGEALPETFDSSHNDPAAVEADNRDEIFELSANRKWRLERLDGGEYILTEAEVRHSVYAFQCRNVKIVVPRKVNNITLDNCENVRLAFSSTISSLELVNCHHVHVVCTERVATIQVDLTREADLFLPLSTAYDTRVVSASCDKIRLWTMNSSEPHKARRYVAPTSIFGDQRVAYLDRTSNRLMSRGTEALKHEGYITFNSPKRRGILA